MSEYVKVARLCEIPEGTSKTVWVNQRAVGLFNVEGTIYAISDACPHEGVSLASGGDLDGPVVTCGYHFWAFDVRTGESADGMDECVETYDVRIDGGDVFIVPPKPFPGASRGEAV